MKCPECGAENDYTESNFRHVLIESGKDSYNCGNCGIAWNVRQQSEIEALKNEVEMYEAMKEGFTERIKDKEAEIERLKKELAKRDYHRQRLDFAYGNTVMSNPRITKQDVALADAERELATTKKELAEHNAHAAKCVECGKWTCGFCGMHDEKGEWRCEICHHGKHVCGATEELALCRKALWLFHPDPLGIKYGDDGEMQLNGHDFLREPIEDLINITRKAIQEELSTAQDSLQDAEAVLEVYASELTFACCYYDKPHSGCPGTQLAKSYFQKHPAKELERS